MVLLLETATQFLAGCDSGGTSSPLGMKYSAPAFMQYLHIQLIYIYTLKAEQKCMQEPLHTATHRLPVGRGPSLKTCPAIPKGICQKLTCS